jgi:type IV pilus assembly protein PilY1
VHGDVLHSRPAVINYNRGGTNGSNTGDNDVFAYYGGNDGILHAVQGGFASNGGDEIWGFIAPESFGKLKRLRDNIPLVGAASGTASPRDYFFDGPIGVYTVDANRDGKLLAPTDNDKVYLFVGMRRGGRYIYALDVSDPANPKFMWKRGCPNLTNNTGCDTGFEELGQTWSEPKVGFLKAYSNPVLIFGAGYDPAVEDFQPCLITASSATSVTAETGGSVTYTSAGSCTYTGTTSTTVNRSMGRGVFIVDATNGSLLFRFGLDAGVNMKQVTGMQYAMPADVVVLNRDGDNTRALPGNENIQPRLKGHIDRIYAVDTGGNVWRLDVDSANTSNWVVTQLASLSGTSLSDKRKFLFSPDVVFGKDGTGNFDAVLLGSGDREHPFDATITDRFYMLKDRKTELDATGQETIVDATFVDTTTNPNGLFDATSNCLQDDTVCAAGSQARVDAKATLLGSRGWKLTLRPGEKDVGTATTLAGTTFFNTNQPAGSAGATDCTSNLGVARQYAVGFQDATATISLTGLSGELTTADRSAVVLGGGFLPSPVPLIVNIDGKKYQSVISGTQLRSPGGLKVGSRVRTYWFRKLE